MIIERRLGPPNISHPDLVPLKKVAEPTNESTDTTTRDMVTRFKQVLLPRFPLQTSPEGLMYKGRAHVQLLHPTTGEHLMTATMSADPRGYQLVPNQPVQLITGMCLFGATGLQGRTTTGEMVSLTDPISLGDDQKPPFQLVDIVELPMLHPSEVDTTLRIVKAMSSLLEAQEVSGQTGQLQLNFHLPAAEYHLYMLDLLNKGAISEEQFQHLCDRITRRSQDLAKIVGKRLPALTTIGSPLDGVVEAIRANPQISLDELIAMAEQDPIFAAALAVKKPADLFALAELSYKVGYLQVADLAQRQQAGCLAVDILEETKILDQAKEICKAQKRKVNMAALYITPTSVSLHGRHGRDAIFMHEDADPHTSPLAVLRAIVTNIVKGG